MTFVSFSCHSFCPDSHTAVFSLNHDIKMIQRESHSQLIHRIRTFNPYVHPVPVFSPQPCGLIEHGLVCFGFAAPDAGVAFFRHFPDFCSSLRMFRLFIFHISSRMIAGSLFHAECLALIYRKPEFFYKSSSLDDRKFKRGGFPKLMCTVHCNRYS